MKRRWLFKGLALTLLLGILAAGWLWKEFSQFRLHALDLPPVGAELQVPSGASLAAVARQLHTDGMLPHPAYLVWLGRWTGQARGLRAGEYHLPAGITPPRLLDLLVAGKVVQHSLGLVEGWDWTQVRAAVRKDTVLVQTLEKMSDEQLMERLGEPGQHPEGWFFPDTYHFPRGTTDLDFLRRAHESMKKHLHEAWSKRAADLPLKSPYEALILASIIEKETGAAAERPRIAGVFARRLKKGMKLQTDPTVIYGLGAGFDGNLRRRDLKADTPYNTYVHTGLPPTPIAMPGWDALWAATHPAPGKALYFVARGDGTHVFSANLKDHNRAVRQFQLRGGRP